MKAHCVFVSVALIEWTSIQGTVILVKWVSHKWRLHCRIMFVSITSIEGTSPFRGHLSWSPECSLNGGSTVRPHQRVRCPYGKVTRGFFLRCPSILPFGKESCEINKEGLINKGTLDVKILKLLKKFSPPPTKLFNLIACNKIMSCKKVLTMTFFLLCSTCRDQTECK